jgi:hypothetical protein
MLTSYPSASSLVLLPICCCWVITGWSSLEGPGTAMAAAAAGTLTGTATADVAGICCCCCCWAGCTGWTGSWMLGATTAWAAGSSSMLLISTVQQQSCFILNMTKIMGWSESLTRTPQPAYPLSLPLSSPVFSLLAFAAITSDQFWTELRSSQIPFRQMVGADVLTLIVMSWSCVFYLWIMFKNHVDWSSSWAAVMLRNTPGEVSKATRKWLNVVEGLVHWGSHYENIIKLSCLPAQ